MATLVELPAEVRQMIILEVLGQCLIREDVGRKIMERGVQPLGGRINNAEAVDKKSWKMVTGLRLVCKQLEEDVKGVLSVWLRTGPEKPLGLLSLHQWLTRERSDPGSVDRRRVVLIDAVGWWRTEAVAVGWMLDSRPVYVEEEEWSGLARLAAFRRHGWLLSTCWGHVVYALSEVVTEFYVVNCCWPMNFMVREGSRVCDVDRWLEKDEMRWIHGEAPGREKYEEDEEELEEC